MDSAIFPWITFGPRGPTTPSSAQIDQHQPHMTSLIGWVSALLHRRRLILWLPLRRQLLLVLLLGDRAPGGHLVLLWLPLWW